MQEPSHTASVMAYLQRTLCSGFKTAGLCQGSWGGSATLRTAPGMVYGPTSMVHFAGMWASTSPALKSFVTTTPLRPFLLTLSIFKWSICI